MPAPSRQTREHDPANGEALSRRFGLSQFTTGSRSFRDDLDLCRELGISGIEVCESKLSETDAGACDDLKALRDSGLKVTSVQARIHSLYPDQMVAEPADPAKRADAIRRSMDRFSEALPGTPLTFVLIGGRAPDHDFARARSNLVMHGGRLAAAAADRRAEIAFETLHPVMMNEDTFVCTWEEANRICEDIGHKSFRLVCDIWNVWDQPGIVESVGEHLDRVAVVHASDWHRHGPRRLNDRLVPGRGVIPFADWGAMLRGADYEGWVCLEMLSDKQLPDSYLREPAGKVIREAHSHLSDTRCLP